MKRLSVFLLALVTSFSFAQTLPDWSEDHAAALTRAQTEKKDVLVYFSGSDWCYWCEKLTKEILDTEYFKTEAPKQFVLVQADFPRDAEQAAAVKEQNTKLRRKYGVRGFPTLVLTDAQGTYYVATGYKETTPEDYVAWLRQAPILREVLARVTAGKLDEALAEIEKYKNSEKPFADLLQQALVERAKIFERQGKAKEEVIAALQDAVAADPQSPLAAQLQKIIAELIEN